ncbi:MAG: hypothetical protein GY799_09005 [Desulfobulbaceae bacterium]|nr:hypothetical protein [Desulfobulbaceae bacterium]
MFSDEFGIGNRVDQVSGNRVLVYDPRRYVRYHSTESLTDPKEILTESAKYRYRQFPVLQGTTDRSRILATKAGS